MSGNIFVSPILPGKLDSWKQFIEQLSTTKSAEFKDMGKRYQLERVRAWHQPNPDGGHVAAVLHEGAGAPDFVSKIVQSDHPFDRWFSEQIADIHGIDVSGPPPPPVDCVFDEVC